jgi:hypothetical protein
MDIENKPETMDENTPETIDEIDSFVYYRWLLLSLIYIYFIPFIICNIYYSITENNCSLIKPDNLTLSLKEYLIVSTIISVITLGLFTIIGLYSTKILTERNKKILYFTVILYVFVFIVTIIWDIFGAIVYSMLPTSKCGQNFQKYFITMYFIKMVQYLAVIQLDYSKIKK